jgi:hypothetical protein
MDVTCNCAAGGRVDSSWQEDNDRQRSNWTRVFPWFSTQHSAWSSEISESVPRELKGRENTYWMGLSLQHPLRYANEGEDMLNWIVTRDESWVHHYQPKSKRASMQWKDSSSLFRSTKKFKVTPTAGTVMLTVFWDSQGVLLAHFQNRGENMNSASYCEVLLTFRDAVCMNTIFDII